MKTINELMELAKKHSIQAPGAIPTFTAEFTKNDFKAFLAGLMGLNDIVYLSQYDSVLEWLQNSNGKGLFIHGTCGVGKTFICNYLIPLFYLHKHGKVFKQLSAATLNRQRDVLDNLPKFVTVDDIGLEKEVNEFGTKINVFPELVDLCEKKGCMLVASSNLGGAELEQKYSTRTVDRLKKICKVVLINEKSMRK